MRISENVHKGIEILVLYQVSDSYPFNSFPEIELIFDSQPYL